MESFKERARAKGCQISALNEELKDVEHKFKANKVLIEKDTYIAQLEAADASFDRVIQP